MQAVNEYMKNPHYLRDQGNVNHYADKRMEGVDEKGSVCSVHATSMCGNSTLTLTNMYNIFVVIWG
jgi:hypothetical protein